MLHTRIGPDLLIFKYQTGLYCMWAAAFVIHPLNSSLVLEPSVSSRVAAEVGEQQKHNSNDVPAECVPLIVEAYGGWGHMKQ